MGARCTPTTSPNNWAKSARGPPSFPENACVSACSCWDVARSSTNTITRQFPLRTLPGMCTATAKVSPDTSTPFTLPVSTWYATVESQVPPSGSSPIQHGQSTLQVQTSKILPCKWYAIWTPPSSLVGITSLRIIRSAEYATYGCRLCQVFCSPGSDDALPRQAGHPHAQTCGFTPVLPAMLWLPGGQGCQSPR